MDTNFTYQFLDEYEPQVASLDNGIWQCKLSLVVDGEEAGEGPPSVVVIGRSPSEVLKLRDLLLHAGEARLTGPDVPAWNVMTALVHQGNAVPGKRLAAADVERAKANSGLAPDDFAAGLEFAVREGWLQRSRESGSSVYVLTAEGHKNA